VSSPIECVYAPPGEYVKDHTFLFRDGWHHLFSISGTQGYYHGYTGNEETISWSISKDLVDWEFRGHVLHATQRAGAFDQDQIWAPFCLQTPERIAMFYTGVVHPSRTLEYRKLGHDHPGVWEGHTETQGMAVSVDLTRWDKVSDYEYGLGVPGRDSHVVFDEDTATYLLFSTIGSHQIHVARSEDLDTWSPLGIAATFPEVDADQDLGATTNAFKGRFVSPAESTFVMRHPITNRWLLMGNWGYMTTDDPTRFDEETTRAHDRTFHGRIVDLGFAGEMVQLGDSWYRSGVFGPIDHWKLGFTQIEWDPDGAFVITTPSVLAKVDS
jgi:hypothetical protein